MLERIREMTPPKISIPASIRELGARSGRLLEPLRPYAEQVRQAAHPGVEAGRAWYEKREPREKLLLRVLGVIVGFLVVYSLIYSPIVSVREGLASRVATRRHDLIEVRDLMGTYQRLQGALAIAQQRTVPNNPNFSLFSVIEQTLTRNVGRDRIGSITPTDRVVTGGFRQFSVDVKLTGITLTQVVDTLYGVETLAMPITVSNLQLHQRAGDSHSFDVDMTCMALAKNG
jgi:hypothetical protein